MNLLISSGVAKMTEARSPIMPEPTMAGAPFAGPSLLESVLKRYCRDSYKVTTADAKVHDYWERNLRTASFPSAVLTDDAYLLRVSKLSATGCNSVTYRRQA